MFQIFGEDDVEMGLPWLSKLFWKPGKLSASVLCWVKPNCQEPGSLRRASLEVVLEETMWYNGGGEERFASNIADLTWQWSVKAGKRK